MSIKGKTKEKSDFTKETGFFEGKVVAVNPDKEALSRILGTEIEKEPEYLGTDDKGVKKLNVVVWLKNEETNKVKSVRFFLKDTEKKTTIKAEDVGTRTPKKQYINAVGVTTWAADESTIPDWFKERSYRVAHEGEEELYNFVKDWLFNLDLRDADSALNFDWAKLMRGDVRDLREQIGGEYEDKVIALSTVHVVEGEGGTKEYEQLYNRAFLPGYTMKQIRLKKIDNAFVVEASKKEKKKQSRLEKFVLAVTDSQWGIKDFYTLGELETYDPSKNPVGGDRSKVLSEDDTDY